MLTHTRKSVILFSSGNCKGHKISFFKNYGHLARMPADGCCSSSVELLTGVLLMLGE